MSTDPKYIEPPDDSGSDTYARYRYQAKIIFPFVLSCGMGHDIVSVIPEHIEDLLIEYKNNKWRYLQIKSRDEHRGSWSFSHLIGRGGPLRSLYRSYKACKDVNATFELALEHHISPHGTTKHLLKGDMANLDLINAVSDKLKITKQDAIDFLSKVKVLRNLPPRNYADDVNLSIIESHNKTLRREDAEKIYSGALDLISSAMEGAPLGINYPEYVSSIDTAKDKLKAKVNSKRITSNQLAGIVSQLGNYPSMLLTATIDTDTPYPSNLVKKLIAGGADKKIIEHAIYLRAQATIKEIEYLNVSGDAFGESPVMQDVQKRLLINANSIEVKHSEKSKPANHIWNELLDIVKKDAMQLDPNTLFNQDGFLLLGEICELSDKCKARWGESINEK